MKSILKTVLISMLSAFIIIVTYDYLTSGNNDVLENVSKSTNLLPLLTVLTPIRLLLK